MIENNKRMRDRSLAEFLERASGALRDVGRLDSEVALLLEACGYAETTERLEVLLRRAESSHNEKVVVESFRRLESLYTKEGEDEKLARLHERRFRFLRCGENVKPLVAGILDEFTANGLMPECKFLPLHPHRGVAQLAEYRPEFVFIESAWNGNGGLWSKMVRTASEPLKDLLKGCRDLGVPSVFWNKEDPVHFETFLHAAGQCDYVFTTDIDCIPAYMEKLGHSRVFLLPFAAQAQVHNPIELFERKDAFNFAGSYYLRYPERQRDTSNIIEATSSFRPVEIYDRNYGRDHPHYRFPMKFAPMILGSLPFSEIDRAYKGYRYGININTVKQSQTMFARRVYELIASNTVVVSNYSRGLRWMFGDLVVSSDKRSEIVARLHDLTENQGEYRKLRLRALRKVMFEHTYAERLAYIRSKVSGYAFKTWEPSVALIASAGSAKAVDRLIVQFRNQSHSRKHLFIKISGFEWDGNHESVSVFRQDSDLLASFRSVQEDFNFLGEWHEADFYGSNYLTDLTLAARFSDAEGFGKGSFFAVGANGPVLECDGNQYRYIDALPMRATVLRAEHANEDRLRRILASPGESTVHGLPLLAIDEFNYCRDGAGNAIVAELCDVGESVSAGCSIGDAYELAESLTLATRRLRGRVASN